MSEQHTLEFTTTSPAARDLEVSESYVRQLVARGVLPAVRLDSGLILIRKDGLERLRQERLARRSSAAE